MPGGKREDPNYQQLAGYVRKELYRRFKKACIDNELKLTDGIEQAVTEWLERHERDRHQDERREG